MLFLILAIGLAVLAILCAKSGYKLFSMFLGLVAFISFIAFIRNPSLPAVNLPDNIPLPGGK